MSTDNPRVPSSIALAQIIFVAALFTPSAYPTQRAEASVPLVSRSQDLAVVSEETRARINETYGRLRLSFEPNRGQADPQTRFLAHGGGYTVLLTGSGAVLALKPAAARPRRAIGSA